MEGYGVSMGNWHRWGGLCGISPLRKLSHYNLNNFIPRVNLFIFSSYSSLFSFNYNRTTFLFTRLVFNRFIVMLFCYKIEVLVGSASLLPKCISIQFVNTIKFHNTNTWEQYYEMNRRWPHKAQHALRIMPGTWRKARQARLRLVSQLYRNA